MSECCKIACFQNAKTVGKEIKLEGLNCYFSGSEQSKGALLMISDIYGWTLNNARAAADKISKDANIAVYLPEFFVEGDHAPFPPEERAKWDIAAFMKRNPPTDFRKIESASKEILTRHEKLAAMGYCWGAQGALHLGRAEGGSASAVGFAHPVVNDMGPFERLGKPAIFLCCAVDQFFPPERRQAAEQVMMNKAEDGISSKFVLYPGTTHGNLMRGDESNELTANAMADSLDEMRQMISILRLNDPYDFATPFVTLYRLQTSCASGSAVSRNATDQYGRQNIRECCSSNSFKHHLPSYWLP